MRPVLVMLGSKNMIMCRSDRSISSSCTSNCFYFAAYYFWQLRLILGLIFFELKHNLDSRRSIWSSTLKGHPLRRTLAYKTAWSCLWVLNSVLERQFYPVGPNNTQPTWVSMATMIIVKLFMLLRFGQWKKTAFCYLENCIMMIVNHLILIV